MGKILKWVGLTLAGLVGLIAVALVILNVITNTRLNKTYNFSVENVAIPSDPAAIEHGKHLATVHCKSCHGPDLSGGVIFNDPMLAVIFAPDITAGYGLEGTPLSDEGMVKAIRHGVSTLGQPLLVMPSAAFFHLNDQDLGDIIAYLRSIPHEGTQLVETSMTVMGKALLTAGAFGNILHAETIDHSAPRPEIVQAGRTMDYGEYMVVSSACGDCHGTQLTGGKSPNPDSPPAPDLTSSGNVGKWSADEFITAMRTGTTPDGRHLSPFMAWQWYGQMTDDELVAVWMYLQGLAAATAAK